MKKTKKSFLENSSTLLAARRWSLEASCGAGTGTGVGVDAGASAGALDDDRPLASMAAEVPADRNSTRTFLLGTIKF